MENSWECEPLPPILLNLYSPYLKAKHDGCLVIKLSTWKMSTQFPNHTLPVCVAACVCTYQSGPWAYLIKEQTLRCDKRISSFRDQQDTPLETVGAPGWLSLG